VWSLVELEIAVAAGLTGATVLDRLQGGGTQVRTQVGGWLTRPGLQLDSKESTAAVVKSEPLHLSSTEPRFSGGAIGGVNVDAEGSKIRPPVG